MIPCVRLVREAFGDGWGDTDAGDAYAELLREVFRRRGWRVDVEMVCVDDVRSTPPWPPLDEEAGRVADAAWDALCEVEGRVGEALTALERAGLVPPPVRLARAGSR